MGWLWSSTPSSSSSKDDGAPNSSATAQTSEPTPISTQPPFDTPKKELSRDELAEIEFQDLMRELNAPPASINPRSADSPAPRVGAEQSESVEHTSQSSEVNIHPLNLYPRDMSCRAAFDSAFYCQSLGGHFIHNYRYGGMGDCSEHWKNFFFCMRTNRMGYSEEMKRARLQRHYWERDAKYRKGPSSEGVWQMRDRVAEMPFSGDFEAAENTESMKNERERRRRAAINFVNGKSVEHWDDPVD